MFCLKVLALLVFLPFPTESPPILVGLFLLSALVHTRPCLYCAALIVGWLASSCAWNLGTAEGDGVVTRCWAGWSPESGRSIFEPRMPLAVSAVNMTHSASPMHWSPRAARLFERFDSKFPNLPVIVRSPGPTLRALAQRMNVERRVGYGDFTARLWFGLGPPPAKA